MRAIKVNMSPSSYCKSEETKCLLPFFEAVMSMKYADEPFYSHLQFLLTKPLLEIGIVPSRCVFGKKEEVEDNISSQ
jgi:hypothetical protein